MSRSLLEGPAKRRIGRVMSQDAQLDLRVVGRRAAAIPGRSGDERLADLAALLGAHRDVLEIGVARAEPAGRRDALIERRVDSPVVGMHELGQSVQVRALELRELAMLDQERGEGVLEGELLEHVLRRALLAARGLLQRRQLELVEEHLAELGPRIDVEGAAGHGIDLGFDRGRFARRIRARAA